MVRRTYDPSLDDVYVNRDGTIRWDGEAIGLVVKTEGLAKEMGAWRAEVGSPAAPEVWPRYRASYAKTRKAAVADVLEGLEVPPEEGIIHRPDQHTWGEWWNGRRTCICGAFQKQSHA